MDSDSDSDSSTSPHAQLQEDHEWQDAEDDSENITFVSFFDDHQFKNIGEMLTYCKIDFDFDIWKLRKDLDLDFLDQIRLVNYIRSEVAKGNSHPDLSTKAVFQDKKYLQPVLEDDAVLYSLDDAFGEIDENVSGGVKNEVEDLRQQLASLQLQFQNYRDDVQRTLAGQLDVTDDTNTQQPQHKPKPNHDDGYFDSYSYNSIHELMIKDRIRTDAYRDFMYDNKDLFQGKIVLDVGCGTGILSMFCAKAGAKQVIAVDNSDIIDKARENVMRNKLDDRIRCLRGKIEEVNMPVEKVDIIVSEWMGYGLLYESMLDSVIYARDNYLVTGGLMVPSHATLKIAPLADTELRISYIDFWHDVYGFDMRAMLEKAYEEVLARVIEPKEMAADADTFLSLDLHRARVEDLTFTQPFSLSWKEGERLEGFVVWFDMFFARTPNRVENLDDEKNGIQKFSTGPFTEPTHWQQCILLLQTLRDGPSKGDRLEGHITYSRESKESRSLRIGVKINEGWGQNWKLE